jgi:rhodanese-related sulfurtransferase
MSSKRILILVAIAAIAAMAVLAVLIPAPAVRKNIGNAELTQLQASGVLLVDVRTAAEYASGHIAAAINVPLDQLAATSVGWNKTQPVIVYCATGARSAQASDVLAGEGFRTIYNLTAGIAAWDGAVVGGQAVAAIPTGAGTVKTSGKPIFIEFSTST